MRIDHLIARVPDIHRAHAALLDLGFAEAWPVGPFWRPHLTSGVHLGGLNLELLQPAEGIDEPIVDTIVFAGDPPPGYRIVEKREADPDLLRLRGFSGDREELICTNGFPTEEPVIPHFFCRYAPFLAERLRRDTGPFGQVARLAGTGPDDAFFATVDPPVHLLPGPFRIESVLLSEGKEIDVRNIAGFRFR